MKTLRVCSLSPVVIFEALAVVVLLAFMLAMGCTSAPSPRNAFEQDSANVKSATAGTTKLGRVDERGSLVVDANLPAYSSRLELQATTVVMEDGSEVVVHLPVVDSFGGGSSHEGVFPLGRGQYAALRTATVFSVGADAYTSKPDGTVEIKGLRIASDAAAGNQSYAAVLAALTPIATKWSDDDFRAYEARVKAEAEIGSAWAKVTAEALATIRTMRPTP